MNKISELRPYKTKQKKKKTLSKGIQPELSPTLMASYGLFPKEQLNEKEKLYKPHLQTVISQETAGKKKS